MSSTLKSGDILVFRAGDDWIGKSIAFLTKSDVSHAAMVYEGGSLVEMGASGISVSGMTASPGDQAYVMRLDPCRDPRPLIDAADAYINARTRYDFSALVILAGLLIYRSVRPTPKFVKITDLILRIACKEVDKLIQHAVLHHRDKAMICSQLVYQIYRDCGKEYEIRLKGGDLQARFNYDEGSVRLIDLVKERPSRNQRDLLWEPDDLVYHAKNLINVQTVDIERR